MASRLSLVPLFVSAACAGGRSDVGVDSPAPPSVRPSSTFGDAGGQPGVSPCDSDGDGHMARVCGGDDCDDTDAKRHPGSDDSNLVPTTWTGSRVLEHHASDIRGRPAIAMDPAGALHVAHAGNGDGSLRYGTNASGAWVASLLDPQGAGTSGVIVDARNRVHVVYGAYSISNEVRYAFRDGAGDWTVASIGPGANPSLALGRDGVLHVAYDLGPGIGYARLEAGHWTQEKLSPQGDGAAVAVGNDGTVHVTWGNYDDQNAPGLMYAKRAMPGWNVETVLAGHATSVSINLRGSGSPVITFVVPIGGKEGVRLASLVGGVWRSDLIVPTSEYVWTTSTLLDSQGRLHVVTGGQSVAHAIEDPAGWKVERVEVSGWASSALLERGVALHVVYSYFNYPDVTFVRHVTNAAFSPDGIDQNCDGVDGIDADTAP